MRKTLVTAAGICMLVLATPSSEAAPAGAGVQGFAPSANEEGSGVQSIAYRRCWWRHGVRHCRRYRGRGYGYRQWRPRDPEAYPTGSSYWWQEMDRQDRGGRGRP
jgi:hypothetical protein